MNRKYLLAAGLLLAAGPAYCAEPAPGAFVTGQNRPLLDEFESRRRALFSDREELAAVMAKAAEFLRTLPASGPAEAVGNVLVFMNSALRYAPDQPIERGPHEWTAAQALGYGTFNGCVEAERVFFRLFRTAYPGFKARAIGSFNASAPSSGHALVEVENADGSAFLVDTASFGKLPRSLLKVTGFTKLADTDLAAPIAFAPEHRGVIIQFEQDSDIFVEKTKEGYRAARYAYGRVFDGKPLGEELFSSLAAVNAYLAGYGRADLSLGALRKLGIILDYSAPDKSSFLFGKDKARHVVFACDSGVSEDKDSAALEAKARQEYAAGGKVTTCVRR
ncbi:MAG: hypothetical protein A2X35_00315 [Elusimicrobia bacterium GWA2_61_42]|nr:MAG: hypothetical protein A2X35_00315 [Elusimicrobia bacterium GWA2_61_42]OGR74539.1 MAG: hypothetical protein A2X38_08065 [Elusimicrobia bacterium GWC2_61_25]